MPMATTTEHELNRQTEAAPSDTNGQTRRPPDKKGNGSRKFVGLGVVLCVLVLGIGAVLFFTGMLGYGGSDDAGQVTTQPVGRGRLLVTVTEDGNLESASNVEIRCQVAGGGTIIWIIPDGSMVEAGQELVRLDQSVIEDQLNTQKIAYEKAVATKIQADEDYSAAEISVKEYEQGTYLKDLQSAESQIKVAMENMRSAENTLSHTERMFRKGFVTSLQLEADKFAVERAKLDLDAAKTAKKVLEEFTKPKTLKGLQATRDAADARRRSEQAALNLEKDKLDRLQNQLKFSVIKAPQRGMVIFANDAGGRRGFMGNQSSTIEEGAVVRERQSLIRLPDLTKMQVKVTVHESKVESIHPGMPARITVQDRQWVGKVVSVANQPEPGNWFMSSIKEYATIVSLEGDTTGLKPGMTAGVEILVSDLHDVVTVPVSAVVEQNGKFAAWVKRKVGAPSRRPLVIGQTNDKLVEVKDGLKEGDEVILNPRAVVAEARVGTALAVEGDADRFGKGAPAAADAKPDAAGKGPEEKPAGAKAVSKEIAAAGAGDASKTDAAKKARDAKRRGPRIDFTQLDKNKDGKLTKDELPEPMQAFFDQLDSNHDGAVSRKEFDDAMKKFAAARRQQGGGGGQSPGGGSPGAP
jgi:HlyD family secretion protein